MENKIRAIFCFKVAAEAKMVIDQDGNHCEGYVMGTMRNKNEEIALIERERYIEALKLYKTNFSAMLNTVEENLEPLTPQEYVDNAFDDDEDLYEDEIEEKYDLLKCHKEYEEYYNNMINELRAS